MEMFFVLFILFIIGVALSKLLFAGKSEASKNNSFNHTSTNDHFYSTESIDDGRHNIHHHHHHDHGGNCDYGGGSDSGGGDSGGGF